MFMKLEDGRVYCLPDGYEVEDRSLDPIRYVLNPTFAPEKVRMLPSPWSVLISVLGYRLYRTNDGGTPGEQDYAQELCVLLIITVSACSCQATHSRLCKV